jgi:hypothetical protein
LESRSRSSLEQLDLLFGIQPAGSAEDAPEPELRSESKIVSLALVAHQATPESASSSVAASSLHLQLIV